MCATTDVSTLEHELIAACLRRVACVRPVAEALTADECELADLARLLGPVARLLVPADAELTLRLLGDVLAESGGQA